jgi:hypothetical protein
MKRDWIVCFLFYDVITCTHEKKSNRIHCPSLIQSLMNIVNFFTRRKGSDHVGISIGYIEDDLKIHITPYDLSAWNGRVCGFTSISTIQSQFQCSGGYFMHVSQETISKIIKHTETNLNYPASYVIVWHYIRAIFYMIYKRYVDTSHKPEETSYFEYNRSSVGITCSQFVLYNFLDLSVLWSTHDTRMLLRKTKQLCFHGCALHPHDIRIIMQDLCDAPGKTSIYRIDPDRQMKLTCTNSYACCVIHALHLDNPGGQTLKNIKLLLMIQNDFVHDSSSIES